MSLCSGSEGVYEYMCVLLEWKWWCPECSLDLIFMNLCGASIFCDL